MPELQRLNQLPSARSLLAMSRAFIFEMIDWTEIETNNNILLIERYWPYIVIACTVVIALMQSFALI